MNKWQKGKIERKEGKFENKAYLRDPPSKCNLRLLLGFWFGALIKTHEDIRDVLILVSDDTEVIMILWHF